MIARILAYVPEAFWHGLLYGVVPIALAAPLSAGSAYLLSVRGRDLGVAVAFGCLGALVGLFTGASRTGIAGVVLPAIITLVSGFLGYLFSQDDKIINRSLVPGCMVAMIVSAAFAGIVGSSLRQQNERALRAWDKHMVEFKSIEVPLNHAILYKQAFGTLPGNSDPAN